jgi:uncharacterized protein
VLLELQELLQWVVLKIVHFYNKLDPFCNKRKPDDKSWTLDHFFKKLLLIENKMNTSSGKKEAKLRTKILRNFLSDLKREI